MITIRPMEIDDISEVAAIESSIFSTPWSEAGFFSYLIREDTLLLVAIEEGHIVGYCGSVIALNEGDITNVAVLESRQRRGIGRLLLEAMLQKTQEQSVTRMFLEVRESNERAISIYESLGFRKAGIRPGYYESPVEDGILMSRQAEREDSLHND